MLRVFRERLRRRSGQGDGAQVSVVSGGNREPCVRWRPGRHDMEPVTQGINHDLHAGEDTYTYVKLSSELNERLNVHL